MNFKFTVTVTADTAREAEQVMAERLGHDEDYGFDYELGYSERPVGMDGGFFRTVADSRNTSYAVGIHGTSNRVSLCAGNEPCRLSDNFSPSEALALSRALEAAAAQAQINEESQQQLAAKHA